MFPTTTTPASDPFDDIAGIAVDNPRKGAARTIRHLRTRLHKDAGDLTESKEEKGMDKYFLDLDGNKHTTHNKSDLAQRAKDFGFVFRTIDEERWEYIMGA